LELYMQMEQLRFEIPFEYEILADNDLPKESILIPSLLLQPFVENSILHGLMPKETKGKICIQLNAADHLLQCIVEDNGI
ncbi:MAG: sensor protein lytS, partial [Bacteroidia bacterium]